MNNAFGHIPEDVLDFATSQDEIAKRRAERRRRIKEARAKALKAREERRLKREQERQNRPKKTWGNFLK